MLIDNSGDEQGLYRSQNQPHEVLVRSPCEVFQLQPELAFRGVAGFLGLLVLIGFLANVNTVQIRVLDCCAMIRGGVLVKEVREERQPISLHVNVVLADL